MCKKNKNWFKTFSVALAFSLPLSNSAYADVYTFSEDFTDTAAGTVIGDAYVSSGALTLTDNLRETGAYVLPYSGDSALNISSLGFSVTFDYDITNGTSTYYAVGFSFNIGNYDMDYISRLGTAPPLEGDPIVPVGEMGIYESDYSDSMLSVAFDTYGSDAGVRVLYNGVSIASTTSADPLTFDTIGITLDETGQLTVSEGETEIFDINVADYYTPSSSNIIAFSARTGGEDEVVTLDNIQYTSAAPVPEPASMLLLGVGGAAVAVVRKRKQILELV